MRKLVVGAAAVLACGLAWAAWQPGQPPAQIDKKQLAAMMAMKGKPGPEHKVLEAMVGTFDVEFKLIMMPGSPPVSLRMSTNSAWVLGARFVQATSSSPEGAELPMQSISYFGFDQRVKKYFWWGIDSSDTYSVFAEGDFDPATRTMTLLGENLEPGMGKMTFKTVVKIASADEHTISIQFQAPEAMRAAAPAGALDKDGWFTVVESHAVRAKK